MMIISKKSKSYLKHSKYTFNSLKKEILNELNDTNRYEKTRILYEKYPEKSIPLIKDELIRDFNYNFRILKFSRAKRYSVNDLLNSMIIRSQDRAQMANDIINNNLIMFALSWNDFSTVFDIFYDLSLRAFVLFHKATKTVAYLCSRASDPFHIFQHSKEIPLSKLNRLKYISREIIHLMVGLLKKLLEVQKRELVFNVLNTKVVNELPQYRLSSNSHEIIIYFGDYNK